MGRRVLGIATKINLRTTAAFPHSQSEDQVVAALGILVPGPSVYP